MTNRHRAFIAEYLKDFNATRAAIAVGYSPKSARAVASRLLTYANIQAEIKANIDEKQMRADEVLTRLADHARGDMGNFLDIGAMGFSVDLNKAKEMGLTHLVKKVKMRTTTSLSAAGIETETHDIAIELYDAQAALVQIGKALGVLKENIEQKTTNEEIEVHLYMPEGRDDHNGD